MGLLSEHSERQLAEDLRDCWEGFVVIQIDESLVMRAGELCAVHGLAALDGIQLASALICKDSIGADIYFISWDRKLSEAAKIEGFDISIC